MWYLVRDCIYAGLVVMMTLLLQDYVHQYILTVGYSIIMGTVLTGVWVLGHECGHGAFGRTSLENDVVGFVLHSALLVPYFSWKYSHNKHHKYTNHLILGETHVPPTKKGATAMMTIHDCIGDDAFCLFNLLIHLVFGWPAYLFNNDTGGRVQSDLKTRFDKNLYKDHFHSSSQTMPDSLGWKVEFSTLGCCTTLGILWYSFGWSILFWYGGPYLVVNAWLVLYTWLQHTHPNIPHYGTDFFTFLKGALCTIDRPYPSLIDHLHHHAGTTHVAHHIKYSVPHYRAVSLTKELKQVLGPHYNYDPTPILGAMMYTRKTCHYVDDIEGVQSYKSF